MAEKKANFIGYVEAPNRSSGSRLLTNQPVREADYGYEDSNARAPERVAAL